MKTGEKWLDRHCWVRWASVWQIEKFNRTAFGLPPSVYLKANEWTAHQIACIRFHSIPSNWISDEIINKCRRAYYLNVKHKWLMVFFNVGSYEPFVYGRHHWLLFVIFAQLYWNERVWEMQSNRYLTMNEKYVEIKALNTRACWRCLTSNCLKLLDSNKKMFEINYLVAGDRKVTFRIKRHECFINVWLMLKWQQIWTKQITIWHTHTKQINCVWLTRYRSFKTATIQADFAIALVCVHVCVKNSQTLHRLKTGICLLPFIVVYQPNWRLHGRQVTPVHPKAKKI